MAVGVSVVEPWFESVGAWVESVAGDGYLAWAESVLRLVGVHGYFGTSGMGEATPIIAIVIAVIIAAPISPISLSFLVVVCFNFWCRG